MSMKVIFLDIDGTLVNYETKIPESAIKAIQKTRKKGNKVYLTTGRSKAEIYSELWDIGLDGMIGGNGMYIEDEGKAIQDIVMSNEDVAKTVDWMKGNGLGFYLESNNGLFGSDNFLSKAAGMYGEDNEENRKKIKAIAPEMIFGGELYRNDVAKISFCLNPDMLAEAKEKFGDSLKVSSWSATGKKQEFGEFAIQGMDKVIAVNTLLKYLNVKKENTFAIGDAASDAQMIQYCQVGIAMGNSEESLKQVADYITDDVDDDGLWHAFLKYELV